MSQRPRTMMKETTSGSRLLVVSFTDQNRSAMVSSMPDDAEKGRSPCSGMWSDSYGLGHQSFDRCCGHSPGCLGGPNSTATGFLVVASPLRLGGHGQDPTTTTGGSSGEGRRSSPARAQTEPLVSKRSTLQDGTSARRVRWMCLHVVLMGDTASCVAEGTR